MELFRTIIKNEWFYRILSVAITIGITLIIIKVIRRWVSNLGKREGLNQKQKTLFPVISQVLVVIVSFVSFCIVLESLGIDTTPILAITSVGSVAVGFGSQQIVKDVISGFFILSENQFAIDDVVEINDVTGVVEDITLRTTTLRDGKDGKVYIIPNGSISMVTNMNKDYMIAVVDVPVSLSHDLEDILTRLQIIVDDFKLPGKMLEKPNVLGAISYDTSAMKIRVTCKTPVGSNWEVERELRRIIKNEFMRQGIAAPYPRQAIYLEKEKEL